MKPVTLPPQPFDVPPPSPPVSRATSVKVTGNITGNIHDSDRRENSTQYSNRQPVDIIVKNESVAIRSENKFMGGQSDG